MTTLYKLHSAHTEAALTGQLHYAAALRVMLNQQIAALRPDLGRPVSLPVQGVKSPETGPGTGVLADSERVCPRCTSTQTAKHWSYLSYKWCLDCGLKWDFC